MLMLVALAAIPYTAFIVHAKWTGMMRAVDSTLHTAVLSAESLVDLNHPAEVDVSIRLSASQFATSSVQYRKLCKALGLDFVWSMAEHRGQPVLTGVAHMDVEAHGWFGDSLEDFRLPGEFAAALGTEDVRYLAYRDEWDDGRMVLMSTRDSQGRARLFAAGVHIGALKDSRRRAILWCLGVGGGVAFAAVIASFLLARWQAGPLTRLTEIARKIAAGDLSLQLPTTGSREMATLAESFNSMRQAVNEKMDSLRLSEERFRQLAENIQQVFWTVSPDWSRVFYISPAYEKVCGRSCQSVYDNPASWLDTVVPADRPAVMADLKRKASGDFSTNEFPEYRVAHSDGRIRWVRAQAFPVRDAAGKVIRIVGTAQDVTENKDAQRERIEAEERYRSLFNALSEGFAFHEIVCDEAGKPCDYVFLDINPAFEEQTGLTREQLIGRSVLEVLPGTEPHWIETYGKVALTGESVRFESYARQLDKHYDVIAFSPSRGRFGVLCRDITERKRVEEEHRRLQAQVQHAQKLESLGVLAGGIAHDFNNLLVAILGNADLALSDMPPGAGERIYVDEIRKAAKRASELTNQMLAYSGRGQFIVQPLDLNGIVHEMGHLLEVSISKKAVLRYDLAANLPAVEADANQIRQVVMNLITNASDAIGERSGIITLRTTIVEADRQYLSQTYVDEDIPEGHYVCLEVSDTGCGMDAQTKARLFDPFFTTKFTGRGLGLAAVLGIVRGHRGAIRVYSELGKGTTFRILLPTADGALQAANEQAAQEAWTASGMILVVDDEESVRNVAKMMLKRSGFTVLTAADGSEAVETFRQRSGEIELVLLDMTMPRMGGEDAFREIRRIRGDAKVILCSGYNEQDATNRFAGKGLAGFIQKPFELDRLIEMVRSVLDSA